MVHENLVKSDHLGRFGNLFVPQIPGFSFGFVKSPVLMGRTGDQPSDRRPNNPHKKCAGGKTNSSKRPRKMLSVANFRPESLVRKNQSCSRWGVVGWGVGGEGGGGRRVGVGVGGGGSPMSRVIL